MSKIEKLEETTNLSVYTTFSKDEGMFEIQATIWSMVSKHSLGYDHDISEIELTFVINNQEVKRNGFKMLYHQLFGEGSFEKFEITKKDEFEVEYFRTTPYIRKY
jgi:hypothetical protein